MEFNMMSQPVSPLLGLQQRMMLMNGWTTEVVIDVPPHIVWRQVTAFEAYRDWNPFVIEAKAHFEVGKSIHFLEDLKQFGQHWITAHFLDIRPPQSFVWKGHFIAPWLFTVRHSFIVEAESNNHTRFRQIHENSGVLIPFLALRGVYDVSHQGYLDFNQALKTRCEMLVS